MSDIIDMVELNEVDTTGVPVANSRISISECDAKMLLKKEQTATC